MATVGVPEDEESIDKLDMDQAIQIANEHEMGVDIEGLETLDEIKFLFKYKFLCQNKPRENIEKSWSRFAEVNKKTSDVLCDIFQDTQRKAEKLEDTLVKEINMNIPNFCLNLEEYKNRLKISKCPVLVLGDTGAGKSAFINLLLGQSILPCSLLSNTRVICQIMYNSGGKQAKALFHHTGSSETDEVLQSVDDVNMAAFCSELADYIESVDKTTGKPIYKRAEIYLMNDLLKSGLVIVDSPGIGDTQEMTDMVLEFILEAYTFIYLIDSADAGGVLQRFKDQIQKMIGKLFEEDKDKAYRPECALFICNKWDRVPVQERQKVWDDTVEKLKKFWPNFEVSQVYKMSTKEALQMQQNNKCITPRFEKVMDSIGNLLPLGQDILVLRSYSFLLHFVDKCIQISDSHLCQVTLSLEEWRRQYADAEDRIRVLVSYIDSFFDAKEKDLSKKIGHIANDLRKYLREKKTLDKLCSFGSQDIPSLSATCDATKWEAVTAEVRNTIYGRLMESIEKWESQDGPFKQTVMEIEKSLKAEFPKFQFQLLEIENDLAGGQRSNRPLSENVEDEPFIPRFISQELTGTALGTKIAVGIGLSPVWLVGTIVRLPVWGAMLLKQVFDTKSLEKKFLVTQNEDARNLVVKEYALKVVEPITHYLDLKRVVKEDLGPFSKYLSTMKSRMKDQINIDIDALERLNEEKRDKDEIISLYEPFKQMLVFQKNFLTQFETLYLPGREGGQKILLKNLHISNTIICSGLMAEILRGEASSFGDVSVRRVRRMPSPYSISTFLEIEVAYRNIKQDSIVQCLWLARGEGAAYQVLEPLQSSLYNYTQFMKETIRQQPFENCWPMVKQVIDGLMYLHDQDKVLYDLSLDTVAVNMFEKVVITNISADVKVDIQCDMKSDQFSIKKYCCICPELLTSSPVCYQKSHDIYSLGVLMWEVWTCMRVYEQGNTDSIDHFQTWGQKGSTPLDTSSDEAEEGTSDTGGYLPDIENLKSIITKFQPRQNPWFTQGCSHADLSRQTKWWNIIEECLAMKSSANTLVKTMLKL